MHAHDFGKLVLAYAQGNSPGSNGLSDKDLGVALRHSATLELCYVYSYAYKHSLREHRRRKHSKRSRMTTISIHSETPKIGLDLDLGAQLLEAWAAAIDQSERLHGADGYHGKLASAISEAVLKTLPWEFQPPTKPQMGFAASISRRLGVEIPKDATVFRGAMHEFLSEHADRMEGDGFVARPRKSGQQDGTNEKPKTPSERARERLKFMNR